MNKWLKIILLGLIIWVIPFVVSVVVWDLETNQPKVTIAWFYALMAFTGAIGFAIAACLYFRKVKGDPVKEAVMVGIIWYIELLLLDLIVLVGFFGMTMTDYYHLTITYLNPLVLSILVGYIIKYNK